MYMRTRCINEIPLHIVQRITLNYSTDHRVQLFGLQNTIIFVNLNEKNFNCSIVRHGHSQRSKTIRN